MGSTRCGHSAGVRSRWCLLFLAGVACGEDAAPIVEPGATSIAVESARIDFGTVPVGGEEARELVLVNPSAVELPVDVTAPAPFDAQLPARVVLEPEARRTFVQTYAPTTPAETLDASVRFDCAEPASCSASVALAGAASSGGRLQVVTSRVDFTFVADRVFERRHPCVSSGRRDRG